MCPLLLCCVHFVFKLKCYLILLLNFSCSLREIRNNFMNSHRSGRWNCVLAGVNFLWGCPKKINVACNYRGASVLDEFYSLPQNVPWTILNWCDKNWADGTFQLFRPNGNPKRLQVRVIKLNWNPCVNNDMQSSILPRFKVPT